MTGALPRAACGRTRLRLVTPAEPPLPRRGEGWISAVTGLAPDGRNKIFKLTARGLDELLVHAARMERR